MATIPRYPTGTLVKLFPDGVITGVVANVITDMPPRYYVQWDDGNCSCHAQRDLKRVGGIVWGATCLTLSCFVSAL